MFDLLILFVTASPLRRFRNSQNTKRVEPHGRRWADNATKTAVWPVYKFIHVNTVAPFGTFRTKIRKWKKAAL